MNGRHRAGALALLLMLAAPGAALDLQFAGFGTASVSCFGNRTADYVANDQPEGPGRTRACDAGLDSMLGLQADLRLDDRFEFGLQVLADRNASGDFDPEVSVAQLRWRLSPATVLRAGRMPSASFLHAEDRRVRYAMPWVRPPLEVYGLMPVFVQDGVEVLHVSDFGTWSGEWQGGLATAAFDLPLSNLEETGDIDTDAAFVHLTLRRGGTRLKAGYAYGTATIAQPQLQGLLDALDASGPVGADLADDLAIDDSPSHMLALGLSHEQDDWLFLSEFGYRTLEGAFRDQYGFYATLGRRFGPWMPYATVARRWTDGPDSDRRAAGLGDPAEAAVGQLLAATRLGTTSVSFGLSRELGTQATLKFQADWVRPDDDSWGLLFNQGPDYDFAHPESAWLFSLSLDFVF